ERWSGGIRQGSQWPTRRARDGSPIRQGRHRLPGLGRGAASRAAQETRLCRDPRPSAPDRPDVLHQEEGLGRCRGRDRGPASGCTWLQGAGI
ncbi:MAG: Ubiquinol-cytochrome C reductase, cytochrome C1 subunit, partial [uncultured Microvirga sp.]